MDDDFVAQIKTLLINNSNELREENNSIAEKLTYEEVCLFDEKLFSDYEYFDKKYFNEDTFERNVTRLFGRFPLDEIFDEVNDYRKLFVYNKALTDFVRELDGSI